MDPFGQLRVGHAAVGLKLRQDITIYRVQVNHHKKLQQTVKITQYSAKTIVFVYELRKDMHGRFALTSLP